MYSTNNIKSTNVFAMFLEVLREDTVNSNAFIRMPTELRKRIKRVRPHNNPIEILLQHDNARPHASLKARETITKFGC
jgi:hypothetical protein